MSSKSKNFTSTVAGAAILISFTGVATKGIGFLREVLFANYFGLETEFDIYLVGAVLPLTINVIIFHLTQNYLIPAYNQLKDNDLSAKKDFILNSLYIFVAVGFFISFLLYFFSFPIIKVYLGGSDTEAISTGMTVFRLFLITIPINCAISVISTYHHLNFKFGYPAYGQLLLNTSFIIIMISFNKYLGIYIIPWGYVGGSALQLIYLISKTKLHFIFVNPFRFNKKYKGSLSSAIVIIILIESIGQLYLLSDRYFYNYVPSGGIAAINYAQTIFHLPISIISAALATVIFPKFSHYLNKDLIEDLEKSFTESIKVIIIIFMPITILYLVYGDYFLRIFFERGKFSAADTILTYQVLFYFSLSLVFYSIYSILNKMIYSLGLLKKLLLLTAGGIIFKILMNFLLVDGMKQNGLALSTSLSYFFFFLASLFLIYHHLRFNLKKILLFELLFHLSNALVSLLLVKQISFLAGRFYELIEIILFVIINIINIYITKHSAVQIFNKLYPSKKLNYAHSE